MKKILNFSMAALVVMGTILAGCAKNEMAEPETKDNIVTVTTTVSLDENAATKALAINYTDKKLTKTFAVGDQVALVYTNTSSATVKAVSQALTVGDISADGKSASLTFTLTNPNPAERVRYCYPASLLDANGIPDFSPLATQDGTLSDVASKDYSFCVVDDLMPETTLPASVSLTNSLAIVAFTLKDATGTNDITSTITGMTISYGASTYTVTRTAAAGPIYVIMLPDFLATIEITATGGTKNYTKTLNGKTFSGGNFYQQGLLMTEVVNPNAPLPGIFSISDTQTVQFSKGNLQATYNGSAWTWGFAANQWDYIGNVAANTSINGNGTVSSNGTVDLFGWSTAATILGINNSPDYIYTGDFADWGSNATVQAGIGTGWRTLTSAGWTYLFNTRTASTVAGTDNARFAKAYLFGTTHGIILFPDSYTHPDGVTAPTGINVTGNTSWNANQYDATDWGKMEAAGCIFLPAAGYRLDTSVSGAGDFGCYWSGTPDGSDYAYRLLFRSGSVFPDQGSGRVNGYSVRLVQEVVTP